jgi:hypothetical protein
MPVQHNVRTHPLRSESDDVVRDSEFNGVMSSACQSAPAGMSQGAKVLLLLSGKSWTHGFSQATPIALTGV